MTTPTLLVSFAVLWCAPLAPQGPDDLPIAEIERHIELQMKEQSLVGLSVAVGVDGQLVWTRGFGLADLEHDVPATEDTVYRFASVSKPITAAAVLQLAETGKVDLEAAVATYVQDWPEKRWPVTVRQLLCHQGGVRHYLETDPVQNVRAYATATEALHVFSSDPLVAEPGTEYSYSSYGYNLLGAVVEGGSGMPFVEYLKKHIFPSAGTQAMQDDASHRIVKNRARGYTRTGGQVRNANLVDTSYKAGAGGLCGTAADLVRFAHAFRAGKIVPDEARDLAWTRQTIASGKETGYGLGWFVGADKSGRRIVRHGGAQTGALASLVYFVDDEVVVAMLCNSEWCDPPSIVLPVLRMLVTAKR